LKTFQQHIETFQNLLVRAWPTVHKKQKPLSIANGGHYKLTMAFPRCDPGKHVLPIIQRLRWYAQLATRLANPLRYQTLFLRV
jgi:hypothetical protein